MLLEMILSIIALLSAIPIGIILEEKTRDEKSIWQKYFKIWLPVTLVLAILFLILDKMPISLTLGFMALTMLSWKMSK
jgi:hypothetical protein